MLFFCRGICCLTLLPLLWRSGEVVTERRARQLPSLQAGLIEDRTSIILSFLFHPGSGPPHMLFLLSGMPPHHPLTWLTPTFPSDLSSKYRFLRDISPELPGWEMTLPGIHSSTSCLWIANYTLIILTSVMFWIMSVLPVTWKFQEGEIHAELAFWCIPAVSYTALHRGGI